MTDPHIYFVLVSALTEGLSWDWETFSEYLQTVAAGKRDIDVAA